MGEQIHQLKETCKSKLQQWHISPQYAKANQDLNFLW